jgi:hypothetical protein
MQKEIKDYLHLYLGCDTNYGLLEGIRDQYAYTIVSGKDTIRGNVWDIKPILRPLSDMTDSELIEFAKIHNSDIEWYMQDGLCIGRENIGVQQHFYFDDELFFTAEICNNIFGQESEGDTQISNITPFETTRLLLSKHFDLFGLIEAGLAIDKTTLTHT